MTNSDVMIADGIKWLANLVLLFMSLSMMLAAYDVPLLVILSAYGGAAGGVVWHVAKGASARTFCDWWAGRSVSHYGQGDADLLRKGGWHVIKGSIAVAGFAYLNWSLVPALILGAGCLVAASAFFIVATCVEAGKIAVWRD